MSSAVAFSMLKTLVALAVVLGLFLLLARFLQRMQHGPRGNQGQMQMLGAMPVGNRERVMLIQARGKVVMIGVSPGRVYPLHVFDAANDSFSNALEQADKS